MTGLNEQLVQGDGMTDAAKIAGIPISETLLYNKQFRKLMQSHKKRQHLENAPNKCKHLNSLHFLKSERDSLTPELGVFKALHLLHCDLTVIRKNPKKFEYLELRMGELIMLALHFQKRTNNNNIEDLIKHIEEIYIKLDNHGMTMMTYFRNAPVI